MPKKNKYNEMDKNIGKKMIFDNNLCVKDENNKK